MAGRLYDSFNRHPGTDVVNLGSSDSKHPWQLISEGVPAGVIPVGIRQDRAYLSDQPTVAAAVLDAGTHGQDGVLRCKFVGPGVGLGMVFRAAGAADHWRAYQRVYTYQYQSGEETYVSHYNQVFSHNETVVTGYTPKEYLWRVNYTTGESHGYSDMYGLHYETRWHTSSTSSPFTSKLIGHKHLLSGSYYPGNTENHAHTLVLPGFYTGTSRGGDPIYGTRAVYVSQPVYATRPVYSTATGYDLRLARRVTGVDTIVAQRQIAGPATELRISLSGSRIEVQPIAAQANSPLLVTDTTFSTNTKHGITLVKADSEGVDPTVNFIEDFAFAPIVTGSLQPHVLL